MSGSVRYVDGKPVLTVSWEAVQAARAEVAAMTAAGLGGDVDPLVRRFAEARPVKGDCITDARIHAVPCSPLNGEVMYGHWLEYRTVNSGSSLPDATCRRCSKPFNLVLAEETL